MSNWEISQEPVLEKYEKLELIGEGTSGKVYKARDKETGKLVALKKTKLDMVNEGIPSNTLREISLLKMLSKSKHVVRLLDVEPVVPSPAGSVSGKSRLYLVFEYLDTDLKKFIYLHGKGANPKPLDPYLIRKLMFQLCKGVADCHSNGVLHRDLKPENLLLVEGNEILKIADLGIGRAFTVPVKTYTDNVVSLWYRAPEILLGTTQYTTAIDIWSVGCIFAEMVSRKVLFDGDGELMQLQKIFKLLGTPTEQQWPGVTSLVHWHNYRICEPADLTSSFQSLSPQGVDLLKKMLNLDPAKRISAKEALTHPYFHMVHNREPSEFSSKISQDPVMEKYEKLELIEEGRPGSV